MCKANSEQLRGEQPWLWGLFCAAWQGFTDNWFAVPNIHPYSSRTWVFKSMALVFGNLLLRVSYCSAWLLKGRKKNPICGSTKAASSRAADSASVCDSSQLHPVKTESTAVDKLGILFSFENLKQ